jgi:hypothetical protein
MNALLWHETSRKIKKDGKKELHKRNSQQTSGKLRDEKIEKDERRVEICEFHPGCKAVPISRHEEEISEIKHCQPAHDRAATHELSLRGGDVRPRRCRFSFWPVALPFALTFISPPSNRIWCTEAA